MGFLYRLITRFLRNDLADTSDETKGDAYIGFKQPYPGAAPCTVHKKLSEIVSVKDFGAIGDGETDDTSAFLSAIATGKTIHVPDGRYKVTDVVALTTSGQGIFGPGSIYFPISSGRIVLGYENYRDFDPSRGDPYYERLWVEGITIEGSNGEARNAYGLLYCAGVKNLRIEGVTVRDAGQIGISPQTPGIMILQCLHYKVVHCHVENVSGGGIHPQFCHGLGIIAHNTIESTGDDGINPYWDNSIAYDDASVVQKGSVVLVHGNAIRRAGLRAGHALKVTTPETNFVIKALLSNNQIFDCGRNGIFIRWPHSDGRPSAIQDSTVLVRGNLIENPGREELCLTLTGVAGVWEIGEIVAGSPSGATGVVFSYINHQTNLLLSEVSGTFAKDDMISGGNSGASGTIDSISIPAHKGCGVAAIVGFRTLQFNDNIVVNARTDAYRFRGANAGQLAPRELRIFNNLAISPGEAGFKCDFYEVLECVGNKVHNAGNNGFDLSPRNGNVNGYSSVRNNIVETCGDTAYRFTDKVGGDLRFDFTGNLAIGALNQAFHFNLTGSAPFTGFRLKDNIERNSGTSSLGIGGARNNEIKGAIVTANDFATALDSSILGLFASCGNVIIKDNLGIDYVLSETATNLGDATAAINTSGKRSGLLVWDETHGRPLWASGNGAAYSWNDANGVAVIMPS